MTDEHEHAMKVWREAYIAHVTSCAKDNPATAVIAGRAGLVARIAELEEALADMLHAVCHETGFAAVVRADSGLAYPWAPLDMAEAKARAALKDTRHEHG